MTTTRPRSVTLACLWAGGGGLLMAVTLFSLLSNWGSQDLRESIVSTLEALPVHVPTVDRALEILRVSVTIALIASIATVVFAIYAARGHRASRIALTILSALSAMTFVGLGLAGLIPAIVSVMVIVLLWQGEANVFFAGLPAGAQDQTQPQLPAGSQSQSQSHPQPNDPSAFQVPATAPTLPPYFAPPQARVAAPSPRQPGIVTAGLSVALLSSLLGILGCLLAVAAAALASEEIAAELARDARVARMLADARMSPDEFVFALGALAAFGIVWGFLGVVVTVLAWRRNQVGRVLLIVVSAATALMGVVLLPLGIVVIAAAGFTITSMLVSAASSWFHQPR
jgi:hypothetical protein